MTAAILDPRASWLARRRELVTASDAAAILGEDQRRGPLAVYAEKLGAETEETLPMRRGKRMEAVIAAEYEEQTGRAVKAPGEFTIFVHPDVPWLGATPDRLVSDEALWLPLEIKLAIGSGRDWRDEPPISYLFQLQVQIACMVVPRGSLAGLIGPGPLAVSDHALDPELLALMLPRLEHFRWHVAKQQPTPCNAEGCVMQADAKPGTSAAVRRLWRTVNDQTVPLGDHGIVLAERLAQAKAEGGRAKKQADALENEMRALLGDAGLGALPDGRFVRRLARKRGAYQAAASEWVQLDVWSPK